VPTKQRIRLYDVESLVPVFGQLGQEDEADPVRVGQLGVLYLSVEKDELLAE
jgi:hypothetical protein